MRIVIAFFLFLMLSVTSAWSLPGTMTFTTIRTGAGGGGATKDWKADSVALTFSKGRFILTGFFLTGRSEPSLKYQKMVIVCNTFTGADGSAYAGPIVGQSYFTDIFSSGGTTELVKTDYVGGSVTTTTIDRDNFRMIGTFNFTLTSNPPVGNTFKTTITNGTFNAGYEDMIHLEVQTKKNPLPARAGEKQKTIRIIATDNAGIVIPGVSISVVNPLDVKTKDLGKTEQDGTLLYRFDVPADTKSQVYKVVVSGSKNPYTKADDVERNIDVSSRYWIYKCGGVDLFTLDAGEGKEWTKVSDASALLQTTAAEVSLSDLVKIQGKVIIDPTAGQEQVRVEGDLIADNVPLPPSGAKGRFVLSTGSWTVLPNCNNALKYAVSKVKCKSKLAGGTIALDEFALEDVGTLTGLRIKGSLTYEDREIESKECTKSDNPGDISFSLSALFTSEGVSELAFTASNLTTKYIPHVCINDFGIKYNWYEDAFAINGAAQLNSLAKNGAGVTTKIKGAFGTKHGRFDSLYVEYSGDCKPVPETPLCWDGFKFTAEKWSSQQWKDQAVKVIATFKSDEQVLKDKFPPLGKLFDKIGLAALEIGGKWQFPRKFSVINTAKLFKDEDISKTKPWQVEFSQGPCEIDLDKGFTYSYGAIKAGHFGADDYFITADAGTLALTWSPSLSLELSSGAKIRIPDIPSSAPKGYMRTWLEAAKATGKLPKDLGNGKIYMNISETKGVKFEAYVDLTANPDPWFNRLGKTSIGMSNDGTGWKFGFGNGITSLSNRTSRVVEIQSAGPSVLNNDAVQAVALDTFVVSSDVQNVNIIIKGSTAAPTAYVINPAGTKISSNLPDSSVMFVSANAQYSMVSLTNPTPGSWVLGLNSPKPDDSVTIVASNKPKPFTISAQQAGRVVTVKWDGSAYSAADSMRVFLDNNGSGEDGFFIGSAPAASGSYSYTMSDSLTECLYHIYARRDVNGQFPDAVYASGEFTVAKSSLAAPSNITAFCNQYGLTNVSWSASNDPNVTNYVVTLRSMFGTDSTIAVVPKEELNVLVMLDTNLLQSLHVRSADYDGHMGCPGIPQSIALGVDDNASKLVANGDLLMVVPNPASNQASLHVLSPNGAHNARVIVSNYLGQVLYDIDNVDLDAGLNRIPLRTDAMGTGSYTVRVVANNQLFSTTFAIVR